MGLSSRNRPLLFPDPEQESVLKLGLERIDTSQWLATEDLPVFAAHKQALTGNAEVVAQLPDSNALQREFADFLLQHLLTHHAEDYRQSAGRLYHRSGLSWPCRNSDLWQASQWIAEDICLLQIREKTSQKAYRLVAASVCSPSNWRLADKIGRTVAEIHAPVPGYQETLNQRVNRLFARLPIGKTLLRYNWSLQPGSALNWQERHVTEADRNNPHWRIERQTLLRLPDSGAIVFGIRIFLHDLDTVPEQHHFRAELERQIARLSPAQRSYKGLAKNWWQ
jgi:hypothetical protein